jgi:hypothetical protein
MLKLILKPRKNKDEDIIFPSSPIRRVLDLPRADAERALYDSLIPLQSQPNQTHDLQHLSYFLGYRFEGGMDMIELIVLGPIYKRVLEVSDNLLNLSLEIEFELSELEEKYLWERRIMNPKIKLPNVNLTLFEFLSDYLKQTNRKFPEVPV